MKRRLNIGFLVDDLDNYFSNQACKGAELAAKILDANLFIFPGHYIGKPDSKYADKKFEYQYNSVFSLPSERNVDIIYILQGTICSRADIETQKAFLKSLPDVPKVCLFSSVEGYHSVTFDNESGFSQAIRHLIDKHGARKIGFVSGPVTNRDARERLDVYKKVLAEYDIPVDEDLIVYGDFTVNSTEVVKELLDRNEKPDAIVFANDNMAIGGYEAIYERGLLPGKDIFIAGFDDDVFSVSLKPPLTTVEASSEALTYKAVLNAENYINGQALSDMTVDTHLILRSSCGCDGLDVEEMGKRLQISCAESGDTTFVSSILEYLFGLYSDNEHLSEIKDAVEEFCDAYITFVNSDNIQAEVENIDKAFAHILQTDLLVYTTPEKVFNVLQTMQFEAAVLIDNDLDGTIMNEVFSDFYRLIAYSGLSRTSDKSNERARLSRMVNQQTGDIFLMSSDDDIPYEQLLGGLYSVGFKKSILYLFQRSIHNKGGKELKCPKSILLKAMSDSNGIRAMSDEQQLWRTEQVFTNDFTETDYRRTMVVFPLFVGADLYGMLVNELDANYLSDVSTVAFQLSVTIKSLIMIEKQNNDKQNLQNSLERFIRDNNKLDEIANRDELTGLYNRRGFLAQVEKLLTDPANKDKVAVVCYADMDNLKMINDKYGHDDGDFALRTIAAILKESFRGADIVGRFGGDEFVVMALVGSDCDIDDIKARIEHVSKKHNDTSGKPYPIEMSTGIHKFNCSPEKDIIAELEIADGLLYQEKQAKKAKFGSYR
ncbi:MAG: GGDEF domain-containing protein [Saccharofermentans sp.]|nr:GGDEF domain-containing protein [Saccharofermentans sp.]